MIAAPDRVIDDAVLTPIVGNCLQDDTARVLSWTCVPIQGPHAGQHDDPSTPRNEGCRIPAPEGGNGRHVYQVSGTARIQQTTTDWSLILKVQGDAIGRERKTFASGLLDELPDGLAAPRCFASAVAAEGDDWLWIEDIAGLYGESWPWERLVSAARQLGKFNGSFACRPDVLSQPWLLQWPIGNWDDCIHTISQLNDQRHVPLIDLAFPRDVAVGVERLWDHRHRFLDALQRLPKGLGHGDVQRRNLFSRTIGSREQTVLIDWGSTAVSPLGAEIHKITSTVRYLRDYSMEQIHALRQRAYGEYVAGLRDAGWQGDGGDVRLGYAIAVSLCNGLSELRSILRMGLDEKSQARARVTVGDRPIEENMQRRADILRLILALTDEAYDLLDRA